MRTAQRAMISSIVAALFLIVPQVALGWSQLRNNFPNSPTSCDNSASWPCIKWPQGPGGYSITIYAYLDYTLAQANINLQPDVSNSAAQWTAVPARNPFLYTTGSGTNYDVGVYRGTTVYGTSWAETETITLSSDVHKVVEADVTFNKLVTWNHTFTYDVYKADSRKVATHELGHAEALGHTNYTAVMHQGAESFWTPQTNDVQGMQAVYGNP